MHRCQSRDGVTHLADFDRLTQRRRGGVHGSVSLGRYCRALPEHLDVECFERRVARQQRQVVEFTLRREHSVEWVAVCLRG